jgi:hypothetical protein
MKQVGFIRAQFTLSYFPLGSLQLPTFPHVNSGAQEIMALISCRHLRKEMGFICAYIIHFTSISCLHKRKMPIQLSGVYLCTYPTLEAFHVYTNVK